MDRLEQIKNKAEEMAQECIAVHDDNDRDLYVDGFTDGALFADSNPKDKEELINRTCSILEHMFIGPNRGDYVSDYGHVNVTKIVENLKKRLK